jgi:hypothetical protein
MAWSLGKVQDAKIEQGFPVQPGFTTKSSVNFGFHAA